LALHHPEIFSPPLHWNSVKCDDINSYVENFTNEINELYCRHFPIKTKVVSEKKICSPWVNEYIKNLIMSKSNYFQLMKLGIVSKRENNAFKKKVKNITRKAKTDYFKAAFDRNKNNMRRTWSLIKKISGSKVNCTTVKKIVWNNIELTNELDIAESFNKYFSSIATDLANDLPYNNRDPTAYLPQACVPSMFLTPLTVPQCSQIIKSLKLQKQIPIQFLLDF